MERGANQSLALIKMSITDHHADDGTEVSGGIANPGGREGVAHGSVDLSVEQKFRMAATTRKPNTNGGRGGY